MSNMVDFPLTEQQRQGIADLFVCEANMFTRDKSHLISGHPTSTSTAGPVTKVDIAYKR